MAGWAAVSGCHSGQADMGSVADGADGFQRYVAGPLGGPFVGLLEENGADEADDGGRIWKDADDILTSLDFAAQPLNRVGAVDFGAVLAREVHVGEHVLLGGIHESCEPWHLGAVLVGHGPPLGMRGGRVILGKCGADPGRGPRTARRR